MNVNTNMFRQFLTISVMLTALSAQQAEALFKFRLVNRKSTVCASLVTVVRAKNHNSGRDFVRQQLQALHRELGGNLSLDSESQPAIRAEEGLSPDMRRHLALRVYDIERTFQQSRPERRVIGTAVLYGAEEIEQFFTQLQTQQEYIYEATERLFQNPSLPGLKGSYQRALINADSGQGVLGTAVIAAYFGGLLPITLNSIYQSGFQSYGELKAIALLTLVSFADLLCNHVRSYERAFHQMMSWAHDFSTREPQWAYWSKDLEITKSFASTLTSEPIISAQSILWQNASELSFQNQILFDSAKPKDLRGHEKFSIDALLQKDDDDVPTMILVLRTRPSKPTKPQTQATAVESLSAGARTTR